MTVFHGNCRCLITWCKQRHVDAGYTIDPTTDHNPQIASPSKSRLGFPWATVGPWDLHGLAIWAGTLAILIKSLKNDQNSSHVTNQLVSGSAGIQLICNMFDWNEALETWFNIQLPLPIKSRPTTSAQLSAYCYSQTHRQEPYLIMGVVQV